MKKILIPIIVASGMFIGCSSAAPTANSAAVSSNQGSQSATQGETMIAHSSDSSGSQSQGQSGQPQTDQQIVKPSEKKTSWTRSGNPIDVSKYNEEIANAQKAEKANSNDSTKKALAEAYYKRGEALTDARQYASAIGDYRRALKYNPDHAESKQWIQTIGGIYTSMNREIPPEGEEPAPLEVKN